MNEHVLIASPKMQRLAEAACAQVRTMHSTAVKLIPVEWKRFPDSFPNIFVRDIARVQEADVSFLVSIDRAESAFENLSLMYALAQLRPPSLKFILPYFPTGTMERIDHEGQVATADTLAKIISGVAPSGPGPIPLYIWDIHALPIRHYFGPNIAPKFKTGTKLLKEKLAGRDVSIVYPDEGSYKRFHSMFETEDGTPLFPPIICRKERLGERREVTVSCGVAAEREVVIVDDLVHSGGTLIECQRALKRAGARMVSVFATHGVLEQDAWKKFLTAGFERVWITDSCPTSEVVRGQEPFEVLSLDRSVANAIMGK